MINPTKNVGTDVPYLVNDLVYFSHDRTGEGSMHGHTI